jgi:hypothetical protein
MLARYLLLRPRHSLEESTRLVGAPISFRASATYVCSLYPVPRILCRVVGIEAVVSLW